MTNYQINRLDTILRENGISMICSTLAGEQSGFIYQFDSLNTENPVHEWFTKNTQIKGDTYRTETIYSAFVPSGKWTELVAFLQIPASNPRLAIR
jgi:hypothetical protein